MESDVSVSSSLPVEINGEERINQYDANSADRIYSQDDVRELVAFAKGHGVRVIPELDAPAHAGAGWQWGPTDDLGGFGTFCYGDDKVLPITNRNKEFFDNWGKFQAIAAGTNEKKKTILWSSDLTTKDYFKFVPKETTIVKIWSGSQDGDIQRLTNDGYQVIVSNWDIHYLDCGFGGWANKDDCPTSSGTLMIYDYDVVVNVAATNKKLVLGGETALWSENVDQRVLEAKLWPDAMTRMRIQRDRIADAGVGADALQPKWCRQNANSCDFL
ncbi:Aste57867_2960 [Aphanomyces stellatus]|uniref:beta-N-acetylhexosaminidase n=1 Tax=Aphanomyces stellatus TaxID=120398 RepID=A0A485KED4_9STRA|nr:hypothetical protein As57867_002951 [Aphanomyces stellatus]VFT80143.1 Aste57867_2960 [Aphanomyces stellatus]